MIVPFGNITLKGILWVTASVHCCYRQPCHVIPPINWSYPNRRAASFWPHHSYGVLSCNFRLKPCSDFQPQCAPDCFTGISKSTLFFQLSEGSCTPRQNLRKHCQLCLIFHLRQLGFFKTHSSLQLITKFLGMLCSARNSWYAASLSGR